MTTNKEKKAAYDKKRRLENPEYYTQQALKWNKSNRDKVLENSRRHWIKKNYGISLEEYQHKLESQHHCCAICGEHESNFKRRFAVDHNHITGAVRDLLCAKCNLAFGYINEDINILEKMIDYAKRHTVCEARNLSQVSGVGE